MLIAFLDPLEQRLSEFPSRYLAGHETIVAGEPGRLPAGVENAEAVVWSSYPSEESRKMLSRREFGLMKPSAIFVNTGRGNTVDEAAIVEALRERRIRAAGLDVFPVEPLPLSSPLLTLENVVLTPHTAGGVQGWMNTFERIAENLRRVEAHEPVLFPMRPDDPEPFG